MNALDQPSATLSDLVEKVVERVMIQCCAYATPENAGELWKTLLVCCVLVYMLIKIDLLKDDIDLCKCSIIKLYFVCFLSLFYLFFLLQNAMTEAHKNKSTQLVRLLRLAGVWLSARNFITDAPSVAKVQLFSLDQSHQYTYHLDYYVTCIQQQQKRNKKNVCGFFNDQYVC